MSARWGRPGPGAGGLRAVVLGHSLKEGRGPREGHPVRPGLRSGLEAGAGLCKAEGRGSRGPGQSEGPGRRGA